MNGGMMTNSHVSAAVSSLSRPAPSIARTEAIQPRRLDRRQIRRALDQQKVHEFVESLVGEDLHAKRVLSVANGVTGVIHAAALSIHAIGQGLAQATGANAKHAVKQVDRLLSNAGVNPWDIFEHWVRFVLTARTEVVVALDWTDYEKDDQTTIALHVVTSHGRATPLMWKTVVKSELKGERNNHEDELIERFVEVLPRGMKVTLLADRGFGDQKLYARLQQLGLDFIIRFRGCIEVTDTKGETRTAQDWVPKGGQTRMLRNARVTQCETVVAAVVCVHQRGMKEPWCLATSRGDLGAGQVVKSYSRRFTIEEGFRDQKDLRFGMGLRWTRIGSTARRDRLLLLAAMAQALMTLLGAAAEEVGLDRMLKVNTVKRRTHSLFRQGCYWYGAIPNMCDERLATLMEAFGRMVSQHAVFTQVFGLI
jgi:hypothetical protein